MVLIRNGKKTVELRSYDLPDGLTGQPLAIIATHPGQEGVSSLGDHVGAGISGAHIVSPPCDYHHVCLTPRCMVHGVMASGPDCWNTVTVPASVFY